MARSRRTANPQHNTQVPRISVLGEQVALIRIQQRRLDRLLALEDLGAKNGREVSESIGLLQAVYQSHFRIQQELGLEPAYLRSVRPNDAPSGGVPRHPVYTFLSPNDARRLLMIEDQANRGEIDVVELYKATGALIQAENARAARTGWHA